MPSKSKNQNKQPGGGLMSITASTEIVKSELLEQKKLTAETKKLDTT